MSSIWIQGSQRIQGEIAVQGCKNAVLPMMAASLLTDETVMLRGCPEITDVEVMAAILRSLGCEVKQREKEMSIVPDVNGEAVIPGEYAGELRASGILLGALAASGHTAVLPRPGGCTIGARPMDIHILAFRALGYAVSEYEDSICVAGREHAHAARIRLPYPSVGATENAILASVLLPGTTEIMGAAKEPEIQDLAAMLCGMGAGIQGAGQDCIRIDGVHRLHGVQYQVMQDRIVAGTYLLAAAATGGEIDLWEAEPRHLTALLRTLREMGCRVYQSPRRISLMSAEDLRPGQIRTGPHPQYPTDLQAVMMAAMLRCKGLSVIRETVFENRYKTAGELKRMGADIQVEGGRAMIHGGRPLYGAVMKAPDLRGGAALVIAGMMAEGPSRIENAQLINRGYENIVRDLKQLQVRSCWG